MKALDDLRRMYPRAGEVYQTSDGLLHLTRANAQAQARHLQDGHIVVHSDERAELEGKADMPAPKRKRTTT